MATIGCWPRRTASQRSTGSSSSSSRTPSNASALHRDTAADWSTTGQPRDNNASRRKALRVIMTTTSIGRIVVGCLAAGVLLALALVVVGPLAGAQEYLITGTVLITFAASWALLA